MLGALRQHGHAALAYILAVHIHIAHRCCAAVVLQLMLGATLAKGPGRCCPPLRVVLGVTAARLLLLPMLGTGWLLLASRAGTEGLAVIRCCGAQRAQVRLAMLLLCYV
jgi:hypothetical protein